MREKPSELTRSGFRKPLISPALALCVGIGTFTVWWLWNPIEHYRLYALLGRPERQQLQVLKSYREQMPCDHLGRFVDRDGEVGLEFELITSGEDGYDLGCLENSAPEGFLLVKVVS